MQCKKCGKTIPDTAKFCAACGWKVEVIPETPVSVPAEENPEPVKPEQSNLHEEQDTAAQKQTATEQTSGTQEQTMNVQPPVYQNQFEQKASSSQQTPNQKKKTETSINTTKIVNIGLGLLTALCGVLALQRLFSAIQNFVYYNTFYGLWEFLNAGLAIGMTIVLILLLLGGISKKETNTKTLFSVLAILSVVLAALNFIQFIVSFFRVLFNGYMYYGFLTFLQMFTSFIVTLAEMAAISGLTYCLLQFSGKELDFSSYKQQKSASNNTANYGNQKARTNYENQTTGANYGAQNAGAAYSAQSAAGAVPLKTDRGLLGYILLSIVTCGIYSYYFIYTIARDVNVACEGDGQSTGGLLKFILLSILTCGIYSFWWEYSLGNRLAMNAPRYGMSFTENGTSVLMWLLFGVLLCGIGPYIAMNILIKNTNSICMAYNRQHGFI
ncbi:DUF4234 domain-containing protein [Mediterraneibacter agrestimuris]|uniref:DUF4234 domain-containing protein n=1 Tax=Mediterraneibacter agrestimuris TaxID=2941333 RepID=UPI00203F6964|nr:DUF4234 domain-containing protein [Mediterraneibacter agrestimuris]